MRGWPVPALVLLVCLTACGSDEPDTLTGPKGDIDCAGVIDFDVGVGLGWDTRTNVLDVEVEDGRCSLEYPGLGTATAGALDGEGSARARYDEACGHLVVDAQLTAALVGGGGTGCAQGLDPTTETGLAELVLLTTDDVVLQLRVDAKAPLDERHITAGLRDLARNAQHAW
jgi:hypothetical protein